MSDTIKISVLCNNLISLVCTHKNITFWFWNKNMKVYCVVKGLCVYGFPGAINDITIIILAMLLWLVMFTYQYTQSNPRKCFQIFDSRKMYKKLYFIRKKWRCGWRENANILLVPYSLYPPTFTCIWYYKQREKVLLCYCKTMSSSTPTVPLGCIGWGI